MKKKTLLFKWVKAITPLIIIAFIFLSGTLLLFSTAAPETKERLEWIEPFVSLPVIELSHFLASIVGLGLILLARGLWRRLDSAFILTLILLFLGILLSLLKGFNYEEALILGGLFIALFFSRNFFYRKGSLATGIYSPGWFAALSVVIICFIGLGLFSYQHIEYSNELWWKFELSANAPRFLRATVGIFIFTLLVLLQKLLNPGVLKFAAPDETSLRKAGDILEGCPRSSSNLVFLKDKSVFFNEKENCFLMYRIKNRSWIVLGDPVGPPEEWASTIREFLTQCDMYNGMAVFTEISQRQLPVYLDMGFSLLKLGEEARIHLPSFLLEAPQSKDLRHTLNKTHKQGFTFSILFPPHEKTLWPQLKQISDTWLRTKKTKEKQFSLGFYDENYLSRFPIAVVTLDDEILAFANIWPSAHKEEFSIDLMRYRPGKSPHGTMEYLFTELILWGKSEGYKWFSLGALPNLYRFLLAEDLFFNLPKLLTKTLFRSIFISILSYYK